jgi:hypothetical protein
MARADVQLIRNGVFKELSMRSTGTRASILLTNIAALATAAQVHGQTKVVYVDDDAPPNGDGTSWEAAYADLQMALLETGSLGWSGAPAEVEYRIAQGTYLPDMGTGNRLERFRFHGSVTSGMVVSFLGGFGGLGSATPDLRDPARFATVLSGDLLGNDTHDPATRADNSLCIAYAGDVGSMLIDGLTFRGSQGRHADIPYEHGGALVVGGIPCSVMPCSPREKANVVRDCRFIDNVASSGRGALTIWGNDIGIQVHVEACEFLGNRGLWSGEIPGGSAIFSGGGLASVERSRFIGNTTAGKGGALHVVGEIGMTVQDCVFAANSAGEEGGAVFFESSRGYFPVAPLVERCTFSANEAPAGRDIACGLIQIRGSILHDGGTGASSRIHVNEAMGEMVSVVTISYSNIQGGIGSIRGLTDYVLEKGGNFDADPMFDHVLGLLSASPCIDAGSPVLIDASAKDGRGLVRLVDGDGDGTAQVDVGAYEYQIHACDADFDGSGFVDTDDFDAFVRAFEAGC